MGRIVVTEFASLDGVVEDPGGSGSFRHKGWSFDTDRRQEGVQSRLPLEVLAYLLSLAVALTILYAVWFLAVTLVIWSGRIENIHFVVFPFLELARVPTDVFLGVFRPVLTFVIPIAFVSTVPARALLGLLDLPIALYGVALALALLLLSRAVWTFALRRYTSASS